MLIHAGRSTIAVVISFKTQNESGDFRHIARLCSLRSELDCRALMIAYQLIQLVSVG